LFKQIQYCADYSEAGGVLIGHPQQINVGYAKIFATGHFMSACCRWNEKPLADKTWAQFKAHFSAVHRQHKQIQGESATTAVYHSTNEAVGQTEDQMAEATIGALSNLATAASTDNGVVETLAEANARLVKKLEDNSNELREINREYLCDVALNDVLCDNRRDFHVLSANKRQIAFGGPCLLANGISCPLLLIFFV
jgi:hypothetical protein